MSSDQASAVNGQIIDAVMSTVVSVLGSAPAEAQAVAYESLTHSLSLLMHNATQTQHGMQQIETAAVATTCALITSVASKSKV